MSRQFTLFFFPFVSSGVETPRAAHGACFSTSLETNSVSSEKDKAIA